MSEREDEAVELDSLAMAIRFLQTISLVTYISLQIQT